MKAPKKMLSRVFAQLGRLKIGNAPNTGITGDQVPANTVIDFNSYQSLRADMNLAEENKQELENLKLIGDVTGMGGSDIIIPGTGAITSVNNSDDTQTILTPEYNAVYIVHSVEWEVSAANAAVLEIKDPDGLTSRLQAITGVDAFSSISQASGKYISYPLTLTVRYDTRSGANTITCAYSRVK